MVKMPLREWARRLGALAPKRMTASWSGSFADPTETKVAARCCALNGGGPSVRAQAASLTRRTSACPGADRQLTLAHGLVATVRVMEGVEHRPTSLTSQVPFKGLLWLEPVESSGEAEDAHEAGG